MSTQSVHFLKITGRLANEFEMACETVRQRKTEHADSRGTDDFRGRERERIDHLGLALLSTADALPVIWHSRYVDGYGWGWSAEPHGGWVDGISRSVYSANTNIAYFPHAILSDTLKNLQRKRKPSFYDLHLRMAIEALAWAKGDPLIVVISRCLGGSLMDDDVHAAAEAKLKPLLLVTREQVPPQIDGRTTAGLSRSLRNLTNKIRQT